MELEIFDKVYKFRFGIGFMKEINSRYKETGGSITVQVPAGYKYVFASMLDGDMTALADILLTANKTENPRLSSKTLYDYLDDNATDIDALVDEVTDFLSKANACKKLTTEILAEVKKQAEAKADYEKLKKKK